ncbi:amidoligase family protein [Oscillibacter valericigenes]|uniref:amidoligase family protein n=1 Tax=Oscillibacter valericigenes TaxID=351091 RepID=UPI001F46C8BD|nr:amidoligase family protein [Oscillibacter valericigenes]MCF2664389.1 amidoligase family protein [Oscillibacter valericigenes]
MMTETFICCHCGQTHPLENRVMVGDDALCERCANEETVICSRCGERVYRDDNAGDENTPLCQPCYDRHYTSCERCGRIIHVDDAYYEDDDEDDPLCYDCHTHARRNKMIEDYYYKPEPLFRGDGSRYFGVELEIDGAGEDDASARKVMEIANGNGLENLYCKHDGSLDDGFEMVTHPMTLEYHMKEMPWGKILQEAIRLGYTSHQANTCGLHVHVNRDAFGDSEEAQDAVIARILYFFEKNWEELLKFSRRTPRQLERWATRYGYKDQPKELLDHAKKGYHGGRYTSVNLTNVDTIEFRIFRGTLKFNTLIATLQLLDRICDVAICLTDDQVKAMSWTTFASGCTQPELVQYLKERRLYVNDPVESEEEV